LLVLAAVLLFAFGTATFPDVMDWAVTHQRAFQNEMAGAVRAIRSGAPGGWAALLLAAGAYLLIGIPPSIKARPADPKIPTGFTGIADLLGVLEHSKLTLNVGKRCHPALSR
jgi:hypothetical protein